MSCWPGGCDIEDCDCYSDVDVYYAGGSSASMCSNHAWDECELLGSVIVIQVIPQHGSDDVNIKIPEEVKEQFLTGLRG